MHATCIGTFYLQHLPLKRNIMSLHWNLWQNEYHNLTTTQWWHTTRNTNTHHTCTVIHTLYCTLWSTSTVIPTDNTIEALSQNSERDCDPCYNTSVLGDVDIWTFSVSSIDSSSTGESGFGFFANTVLGEGREERVSGQGCVHRQRHRKEEKR